ncbi:MAG: tryptophan 7-halogenase, partial [Cycloclasticus sp.]|uniref:tryptophan 7-halogenase n=1 Tax=Cycloclasticus sp. TaxID=2024830 RepID=UPI00257F452F
DDDRYAHPFVLPQGYNDINLVPYWQSKASDISFSDATSFQSQLCDNGLAPKQNTTPEYAHVANYAYHLDAGKLVTFLQKHCIIHFKSKERGKTVSFVVRRAA